MLKLLSTKEWLKAFVVVALISVMIAAINPLSRDYVFSFFIIFAMFGGTAIPLHLYATRAKKLKSEYYTAAGMICGGLLGAGYPIFQNLTGIGSHTPVPSILVFGVGGIFLGLICSSLFWRLMVSKSYEKSPDAQSPEERKSQTRISCLNIMGFLFGCTISSIVTETVFPVLLREEVTITAYVFFTFGFPLIYLLAHVFITKFLIKGHIAALIFILFEIVVVVIRSVYSLPLAINSLGALFAIILSVICFFLLRGMAAEIFSQKQHTVFKYAQYLIAMVFAAHVVITSLLFFRSNYQNQKRSNSGEWHAQFQPQDIEETEENADQACLILESQLKQKWPVSYKDAVQYADDTLSQANVYFSYTGEISEARVLYHFKPSNENASQVAPEKIEEELLRHVTKEDGIKNYADWKAKYGLFFEFNYDIFYILQDDLKLGRTYLDHADDNTLAYSVPLKDPLNIQKFWEIKELQTPPNYLNKVMLDNGYEFDYVELWDAANFNYVYDLNGLIRHLLFTDVSFFRVSLNYLAKREPDQSISQIKLQDVLCSYPFRNELYDRPEGISYAPPYYPDYKRCHEWRASVHCPGLEKPIKHKTNICRQLGEAFPECPIAQD